MEKDKEGQPDLHGQREARGRVREDYLAAGRQLAADERAGHEAGEGASRPGHQIDNDDVSELSENDSSGG